MPRSEMDLRRTATAKIDEAKRLQSTIDDEDRTATEEEAGQIEALMAEHVDLLKEADRKRKLEEAQAYLETMPPRISDPPPITTSPFAEPIDHEQVARCGFRNLGEWATSVMHACTPGHDTVDQRLYAATGMGGDVGSAGGFLMPPAFSTQILDYIQLATVNLVPLTDNYTVTGESLTFVANAETSRASTIAGGAVAYWIAEAAAITASAPTFRQIKIEPHQLAILVYCTDRLLKNSATALEQYLSRKMAEAIVFKSNDAIINGTGAGQPLGILTAACTVSVAKVTSQTAATIVPANIFSAWSRLAPQSRGTAVWLANPDIVTQLMSMAFVLRNAVGAENVAALNSGLYDPQANTLMGRPVIWCENCATLGTAGDLILADLKGYLTGTRGGIDSAMSIHLRFNYAETAFRGIYELDGAPVLNSAVTPAKGSVTVTHFVTIAARA